MEIGVMITVAIFIGGIIFQMGKLSQRIDNIMEWKKETTEDLKKISSVVDRVDAVFRHQN